MVDLVQSVPTGGGVTSPLLIQAQQNDPRLTLARLMMENAGKSETPLLSPYSTLAKALQQGLSGYTNVALGQEYQDRQKNLSDTLANAVEAAQTGTKEWRNPDTGEIAVKAQAPGFAALASALAQSDNPDAKQLAAQYAIQDLTTQQAVKAKLAEVLAGKGMTYGPGGGAAEIPGYGDVEASIAGKKAGAEAGSKAAAELPYTASKAEAEAGGKARGEMPYVGPKAAAEAAAKVPYETVPVHGIGVFPKSSVLATAPGGAPGGLPSPVGGVPAAPGIPGAPAASGAPAPPQGGPAPLPPQYGGPVPTGPASPVVAVPGGGIATAPQLGRAGATAGIPELAKLDAQSVNDARTAAEKGYADIANVRLIQDFLPKVATGWGADTKLEGGRILEGLGVPKDKVQDFLGTDVASGQILQKKFLELSAGAARGMGAREPGSVIQMFAKAYPNLGTDADAIKLQTNAIIMDRKRAQDYSDMKEDHFYNSLGEYQQSNNYKGLQGFERKFRESNAPELYMHGAEAMTGKTEAWNRIRDAGQQQKVIDLIPRGSTYLAPDGQMRVKQ